MAAYAYSAINSVGVESLGEVHAPDPSSAREQLRVRGLLATKLERHDNQGEVQLEGLARDVAAPHFTVGGVAVTTDGNTEFRDTNSVTISAAAFFQAAPGRQVKARGTLAGNVVLATRAELED